MNNFFKLSENNTDIRTEVTAGITTFMTMAYILAVNPLMLSATGMDAGAVFTATALAAVLGTVAMALLANYPFALAPGMGLNAFFTYGVVLGMGYDWQVALTAVFVEGLIFIILTLTNVREAIFNAIPKNLKMAVSCGIGIFITFIGLQNAGIIVDDGATLVTVGDLTQVGALLALVGVMITALLVIRKVKGAILFGILGTYILGLICQLTGFYIVDPSIGQFSLIPSGIFSAPPSLEPIAFKVDFAFLLDPQFWLVVFTFLFVDLFDTLGTLIGVSEKAGYLDEEGKLPKAKQALLADAIATSAGALMGTSTTTTFVESAAGVAEGGRTGLTSLTTAGFFALALFVSPVFLAIPAFATAPALIIVGLFMMEGITKIDFSDYTEGLPAFLTIVMMPLAYSIAEGLMFGVVSFVIAKRFTGRSKEVSPVMLILAVVFIFQMFGLFDLVLNLFS